MPRPINKFNGEGVIVGRGSDPTGLTYDYDSFYTLDFDEKLDPDLVCDITQDLPCGFDERFKLIVAENLPLDCFLPYHDFHTNREFKYCPIGQKGKDNIWSMVAEEGYILITNCLRTQETRLFLRHFNYIEFLVNVKSIELEDESYDEFKMTSSARIVLIPKNQRLTIQEVQEQIKNFDLLWTYLKKYQLDQYAALPNFFDNKGFFFGSKRKYKFCTKVNTSLRKYCRKKYLSYSQRKCK